MTDSLANRRSFSLHDFVRSHVEPSLIHELDSSADFGDFPLAKALDLDCLDGELAASSDLPYDRPDDARKYLRHMAAGRRIKESVVAAISSGKWRLEVRLAGQLAMVEVAEATLANATINADFSEISVDGIWLVEPTMTRSVPVSEFEQAVAAAGEFRSSVDPKSSSISALQSYLVSKFGKPFSKEHTQRVMKAAGFDEAWSKPGRPVGSGAKNPS